jgi:prepilin-type N-terminal cleavage/methylation domain-containing protein
MPKVGPAPMLMSETGNQPTGFTLLEIVAVITLIGLITYLAYPSINFSVERVEIGYIGRLIKTDFNQLKDESLVDPAAEIVVTFSQDGYTFQIGEHHITRSFKYEFAFDLPKPPETSTDPTETEKTESDPLVAEPETKVESYDLKIIKGELAEDLQLNWQTTHFQGSFLLQKNGTVKWSYGKK